MFSSRLPKDLDPSPFFAQLENAKAKVGASFIDMTISSPMRVGLPFDLKPAVDASCNEFGTWNTDAAGKKSAREAVAEYYRERGGWFNAEQILLTASTSEAYSILFKTFCDPGNVILTPVPGYPLLDTLAQLEHLECYPYFLKLAHEKPLRNLAQVKIRNLNALSKSSFRFVIDTESLLSAPDNAKILLLVSPHNPTGHCVSEKEWNEIIAFCEERHLILVVDEVFGDYAIDPKVRRTWDYLKIGSQNSQKSNSVHLPKCPIFWLNGFSKTVGSPQLKLGWMAFYAPEEHFEPIRASLEYVADAYLSVSAPAQALARPMLMHAKAYELLICERLQMNWATLRAAFPGKYCPDVLGGWYASVRLGIDDEELTLRLLCEKQLLVQPGFFFDYDEDGWIVISLLQLPEVFAEGIRRMKSLEIK